MQTDELRAELAELAREVDDFPEELTAIRRRVTRRRVATMSVTAVVVIGLIAGAIATTRPNGDHVHVAGHPKQVSINALPRVDAVVALGLNATKAEVAGVKDILDSTDVVEQYATLPRDSSASLSFGKTFRSSAMLGVELDRSATNALQQLAAAVGSTATTKAFQPPGRPIGDDVEVFMTVNACAGQIDAVRLAISRDRDVESFRFLSKDDALKEFKQLFRDQPTLIENTTAASLPASFQLRVRDGASPPTVAARYEGFAGVRPIIVRANPFAGATPNVEPNTDRSICAPKP